jgi:mono/diheme cytochrome c family protein
MKRVLLFVVVAMVAVAFTLPVLAQDKVAAGEKVFAREKCSMCHGLNGKGNQKFALDDVGSKLKPEEMREWIVNPKEAAAKLPTKPPMMMKSFANLPKEDVDALVAYLETLKKK